MRVRFRPCEPGDFIALLGGPPQHRMVGIAAIGETGELLGVGGFVQFPNGERWASCRIAPAGRNYPMAIHRAGVMAMRLARELGFARVYAAAEPGNPAAERWLVRLGFEFERDRGAFVWRPSQFGSRGGACAG